MADHDVLAWHDFFIGTIGAAAALTGLLFVAISINLDQILKYAGLPGRAAGTLGMLVSALVVSGFALAPGQSSRVLGVEIAAVGAVVALQAVRVSRVSGAPDERPSWRIEHAATLLLPSIGLVVGGVSVVVAAGAASTGSSVRSSLRSCPRRSTPGCCWSRSSAS